MIRMSDSQSKATLKAAVLVSLLFLFAAAPGFGQQVINLTAGPATAALPDGTTVPMWGYSCGAAAAAVSSTATNFTATTVAITGGALPVNAYVGVTLTVTDSSQSGAPTYTGTVASNTATTLTLAGAGWTTTTAGAAAVPTAGSTLSFGGSTANCAPLAGVASGAFSGAIGGVYVVNGGAGYASTDVLTVTVTNAPGDAGSGLAATAVIDGGQVVGFNVTNHGSGYRAAPSIAISGGSGSGAIAAASPAWSPVLITIPTGTTAAPASLTINLTNNLSFTAGTTTNNIPTSIVIVGQVGGGLGVKPTLNGTGTTTSTASPSHTNAQGCVSWFIAAIPPGTPCTSNASGALPPNQGNRVQSMGTEVAAVAAGTVTTGTALTWANLKPGTYLLESGTHPSIQVPMGLIGMLVVTTAPSSTSASGTAYPAPTVTTAASQAAVPAVTYNAEVPLEFSEIDPVQNKGVDVAVRTAGFSETMVWSGMPTSPQGTPGCGYPGSSTYHQCYPPAVNYTPFYYLINGYAFDKTHPGNSLFAATAGTSTTTPITGSVLVRLVNAGLRMHVPAIVGSLTNGFTGAGVLTTSTNPVSGFTLIAEDGNPVPDASGTAIAPRVKTEVFMAAGKTYDVMVNVPAATASALPIYARDLGLSANSSVRDAGMLAYISVNGAALPAPSGVGATGVFAAAGVNPDTYNSVVPCATGTTCISLKVSDPSKGVIANDVNVNGVALSTPPANGTLTCNAQPQNPVDGLCANGTFTYTPTAGANATAAAGSTFDTFGYCANGAQAGTTGLCTTVTLNVSSLTGNPTANGMTFTSKMATFIKIAPPGVLSVDSDPNNLPLSVVTSGANAPVPASGVTLTMDSKGGFVASVSAAGNYSFTYTAQNSQGRTASATVNLIFPTPSNLKVNVLDAQAYNACNGNNTCIAGLTPFPDYRWIIEEDKTFWVDPNCTTNYGNGTQTPGCPALVGPAGTSTVPTFGVNFHTSTAGYVAQGCTGPLSCEAGQTMLDPAGSGAHIPAVCDLGAGACRPDPNCTTLPCSAGGFTYVNPSQVALDPGKRYYISILPGDAANPFPGNVTPAACNGVEAAAGNIACGHTMGGAPIPPACNVLGGPNACTSTSAFTQPVNVPVLPTPLPTGKLSVIVFEDDTPLNGEQDGGGGGGTIAPVEPGLGGFNIILWDTYGGLGDVTGQDTYDAFNQPLSNSLAGTIDPTTGQDACPISAQATADPTHQGGITGVIVTCPKFEQDGHTLSPLAGQAVIANLMPDKFSVQAYPGADRIARGEEWIQTNTLDGQHPHDSFIRIGEPSYFQEYGPAGYHVSIGFANPAIINARHTDVCNGAGTPGAVGPCTNTISGQVDVQRLSRIPDERLYPSESRDALSWTQCWVSLGDPDGEDFMFTKCDANGNFSFSAVPGGNWRLTVGDQWNDQIIDGLSTPANVGCVPTTAQGNQGCTGGISSMNFPHLGVQQWQSNLYTRTFVDDNKNGILDPGEIGIPLIYTMIHYRDGSRANALTTDFNGIAPFNETFPLFNWYVVEADAGRYKTTGIHTVYDAGGPADGTSACTASGTRGCGTSTAYAHMTNTNESVPLPTDLSVPGAVYCASADCTAEAAGFAAGTAKPSTGNASTTSTGRIDPPWVWAEGWAGLTGHSNYIDFGKAPYAACDPSQAVSATNFCATVSFTPPGSPTGTTPTTMKVGENGGIYGQIQYAATRPFDDAGQMIEQPWEPYVPNVQVNLYQEGVAADGTPTLTLVDTTLSSSWDAWAQGFYPNPTGTGLYTDPATGTPLPYMSCPGQGLAAADLFYYTLFDQPNYLDYYTGIHSIPAVAPHPLPYNSQFKCYDAMKINNQIQPAPYDGRYSFPSVLGINPATGKLVATMGSVNGVTSSMAGTNCTICVANPDTTDPYRNGTPMLPPGKYVVQVVMPPGYEIYKEEDKNLLIGDDFIAPVNQQFSGLGGAIFILPDQASVAAMYDPNATGFNSTNYQNQTTNLNLQGDSLSGVPGFPGYQDQIWPCVGEQRIVPDFLSLFPGALETAPFAGATRPLCDRKEVTLNNQMAVRVKFALFTSTHIASHFTGVITDDFTSEFDPFSPQFGEKFAPPNMPISTKDYLGNEISRVYSDHWGIYNGLTFSSWEVNPPNITGYSPSMMVQCMNDPGPVVDTRTGSATFGQLINDPLYNPAYSDFCYEEPYMPGLTTYLDTPVVPTQALVGAAYNNPDCSYPDATPAIKEVDGTSVGPWVSGPGGTLTITALGDQQVSNSAYAGPSASAAPFNLKTITRHYGFGSQCLSPTTGSTTCSTLSSVTIGGVAATVNSWSDAQITVAVPNGVPNCPVQQQSQYSGGATATQCGQLVITAGNGHKSVDTVTVTIGGKTPTPVAANQSVQAAIDAAAPGDLIMVYPTCTSTTLNTSGAAVTGQVPCTTAITSAVPGTVCTPSTTTACTASSAAAHTEMLIMWKPVRLQGVGAASSIIDANAIPAGKLLDPWRRHINCLFGLTLSGVPRLGTGGPSPAYDPTNTYNCPETTWVNYDTPNAKGVPQIDRIPLEAVVGWDANANGNLAEQLQEPSLMGAYEGAGITVLSKGVWTSPGENTWTDGFTPGAFPLDALLLQDVPAVPTALPAQSSYCFTTPGGTIEQNPNPYPSNFECNPSSIDGLTIRDSSQGGGGIFAHGWSHNLQIANNRVYNNAGTLSGGISIGQGEMPTSQTITGVLGGIGQPSTLSAPPSCQNSNIVGTELPFCLENNVNVHNNYIANNSSLGDELFSATLSGGGGATFCTGADYYKFNYNWVCGNLASGEGGGMVHLGFIYHGDIEHNTITLNQSSNPTISTNGGGIQIMGTPDTDPVCGLIPDADCPPGLSDGTGPGTAINGNLIQANMAESGSGGGIRLQQVNGTEISVFPGNYAITAADEGHTVTVAVPATSVLPAAVGDTVVISGVSVAGYNGTFTVNHIGLGSFTYLANATGLPAGARGTFTDTTVVPAATPQVIATAIETAPTVVTILGALTPTVGDTVVISGVTPTGYNGTHTVLRVPDGAGAFTYSAAPTTGLGPGSGGFVVDSAMSSATLWNSVSVTNNMIVNNLAGWDGAGISLQDALNVAIVNNTISSNDSLASAGVLTQSIGDPQASYPGGNCLQAGLTTSCPQSAGVTSTLNSTLLSSTFGALGIICPAGNTNCASFSNPILANNVIWQNRSFYIGVGGLGLGNQNQQNLVSLFTRTGSPAPTQTASGACGTASYWDLGVRGDSGPGVHSSGATIALNPTYSVLDDTGYAATNLTASPSIVSQYCNGSRVPPECTTADGCGGPFGYGVPVGIVDAQTPNPLFTLNPSATVDEGNNWINVSWGPLSLANDAVIGGASGNYGGGAAFGNYALAAGSPAIDYVPLNTTTLPAATLPNLGLDFYGNPRPDPSNPTHFDVGAVEFQGAGQNGLVSISPNQGSRGSVVTVTITGAGLAGATAVNVPGGGVTVGALTTTATSVTTTFTISGTATLSARNVTVTTSTGATLGPITFTVVAGLAPTLTSINPNSGLRGSAVNVTLTGTNFSPVGTTVHTDVPVTGFTVSNVTVVSATSITATFTSTASTPIGAVNILVTSAAIDSNSLPFNVTGPVLTSIAACPAGTFAYPCTGSNSGNRGTTFGVTLTGTGLTGTTAINVSGGGGITVSGITVVSDTQVNATFTITTGTGGGARNISVTDGVSGTSNTVPFTIIVPPGNLASISPNAGAQGTSVNVTLTGTALTGTSAINVSGGGVTVSNIVVVSDTQVTATFAISATTSLGARNVTVTTPAGTSNPVAFTVVSPGTPTLATIIPTSGVRGAAVSVTLTGTGFTPTGTTVHVEAPAATLTISGVTVVNSTTITATFTTGAGAGTTIGPRQIYVTTPGGTTGTVAYTITGPVLTAISPTQATRGTTVPVSLFGSGLTGTTGIGGLTGGVSLVAGSLVVVNDTQVNATFAINATAVAGARSITVTGAPGGPSNAVGFTVIALPAPTITSVAPTSGVRGTAISVTITGTNFTGATAVTVSGTGVTVSGLSVLSPETATATFTIAGGTAAALGTRDVRITTPSGTSPIVAADHFTVVGPTLQVIAPSSGTRGTTVAVTLTGSNLTGATAVNVSGTNVTCSGVTVTGTTTVNANCAIAPAAALGSRNMTVVTPIGTTPVSAPATTFTVLGATLTLGPVVATPPSPAFVTTPATTAAKTGTITVTNAAAATGPFVFSATPTVTSTSTAGTFASPAGGTCVSGLVLNPGSTCTIDVTYTPTTTVTATATVTVSGSGIASATSTQTETITAN